MQINDTPKTCPGSPTQPAHTLPASVFPPNKTRLDGLDVYCRACKNEKQRIWKAQHKEKIKEYRKNRYQELKV